MRPRPASRLRRVPRHPLGTLPAIAAVMIGLGDTGTPARGSEDTQAAEPRPFAASDISIGEPIVAPIVRPTPEPAAAAGAPISAAPAPVARGAHGWLGFSVTAATVPGRWTITDVAATGPAAAAGIRDGDQLRALNGTPLQSFDEVTQGLTAIAVGDQVRLAVARGEEVHDVTLVARPRPSQPPAARAWRGSPVEVATTQETVAPAPAPAPVAPASVWAQPLPAPAAAPVATTPSAAATVEPARGRTALGVRTIPIDPGLQSRFRLAEPAGAYVIGVVGDLPASKAGIPPGSVIVAFEEQPVRSPQELTRFVTSGPVDRPVSLSYVLPDGTRKRADVVLQSLERPLEQALLGETAPQPTTAPQLEPSRAHRVVRRMPAESAEVRREIGRLRSALDALERRLERSGDGR